MTYYREITPLQEPFDLGLDESGRQRIVFNVMAVKRASATFTEELEKVLTNAGVGVKGTTLFVSSMSKIPVKEPGDNTAILVIVETGGAAPDRTHNVVSPPAYARPTAQVLVRSHSYAAARTMAYAAYNALSAVRNADVTP